MGSLSAGFARIDVTPPDGTYMAGQHFTRYSTGVSEPLFASAVALSDGENTAVLITLDFCLTIQPATGDLLTKISKRTGLDIDNIYVHSTHNHTGPSLDEARDYASVTASRVADAAAGAIADMKPAKLLVAEGEVADIAFCRRYLKKDGTVKTNPVNDPDVIGPAGAVDLSMYLVRIVRDGAGDINIVNFATHPDNVGGLLINPDYPGYVVRYVEGSLGGNCIFIDGAEGDINSRGDIINPIRKSITKTKRMAARIAGEVLRIYYDVKELSSDTLAAKHIIIDLPSNRETDPEKIALAKKYSELRRAGDEEGAKALGIANATAVRILKLQDGPDSFPLRLSVLRIGELAFLGVEGEPFSELGIKIKEASPFKMTVCSCCTNGWRGYFPTDRAYDEGGYEAGFSNFKKGTGSIIIKEAGELLLEIFK